MIYRHDQNCRVCKHFLGDRKCLAFPESIPDDLWSGENSHHEPYPGDQGYRHALRFEEFPALTTEQVAALKKRGTARSEKRPSPT